MKNQSKLVLLTSFISILSAFAASPILRVSVESVNDLEKKNINIEVNKPIVEDIKIINATNLFLSAIAYRESSNRYDVVNNWGYMGKYQFGRATLNNLGYEKITNEQFLSNPKIQEEAMIKLLKSNQHILRREIRKYSGSSVHGVYITESGLLAAAHLAGPGNVKKWLRRGERFRDGLGTDLVDYLQLFSNYKITI
jgi:soluble lytic murein transglycosylase-like protein